MVCRGCQKTRVNTNENESNCLIQVWEGLQVELQGRYSIERFREIVTHAETPSLAWNILFIFASPLPTLASLLVAEALPLQTPSAGLWHQTPGTYLRVVLVASLGMVCVPRQIQQSAPAVLPFSVYNTVLLCAIPAILMVLCFGALGAFWVFPTPFSLFFMGSVAPPVVVTSLWSIWKERLQKNPEANAKVFRFLKVFVVQSLLLTTYIAYYIMFLWVNEVNQPYVSVLLPLIKLTFKNMARSGLYYIEDLAPIIIVANVDVFHTAFVCRTMQQTQGNGAVAFIMTVDIVQSLVAYYEVCSIVRRVNKLAHESQEAEIFASSKTNPRGLTGMTSRKTSSLKINFAVIDYALYLIDTYPRIRNHPTIALPRHVWEKNLGGPAQIQVAALKRMSQRIRPVVVKESRDSVQVFKPISVLELSLPEQSHVKCVESVLRMLHMIEFYVLIEFVEAALAGVFVLHVLALSHMPNRVYYFQLHGLSELELEKMVQQLAKYAGLEILSFVVFCATINWHLQRISTIQQLAFVVRKHWSVFVSTIAFWVFLAVQLTLEHFGLDFTFEFVWMR